MSPLENVKGSLAKEVRAKVLVLKAFAQPVTHHQPGPAWGSAAPRSKARESTPTPRKIEAFHTCLLLLEILKLKIKRSFLSPKSPLPFEADMQMSQEKLSLTATHQLSTNASRSFLENRLCIKDAQEIMCLRGEAGKREGGVAVNQQHPPRAEG